jgi:glyoxylase-like metal-dependent hydrolase (beta-lactamase superfamily II)
MSARSGMRLLTTLGVVLGIAGVVTPLHAQANVYNDGLLARLRGLGQAVPGALPVSVHFLSVQDDSAVLSNTVEGAPKTRIFEMDPVFQLRYSGGWIMVDAGITKAGAGTEGVFYQDRFDRSQAAIARAGLIVVTHEHGDHTGALLLPTLPSAVAARTMLNRAQVRTFMSDKSMGGVAGFDSAQASRYLVVDYNDLLPIGPGVVLMWAPGHTPGSQMVYVRLASGREMILAGDVVWNMAGIDLLKQKPDSTSRHMREDRTTIQQQITWLKNAAIPAGITVVVSHDGNEIQSLAKRGVLTEGLDVGGS